MLLSFVVNALIDMEVLAPALTYVPRVGPDSNRFSVDGVVGVLVFESVFSVLQVVLSKHILLVRVVLFPRPSSDVLVDAFALTLLNVISLFLLQLGNAVAFHIFDQFD